MIDILKELEKHQESIQDITEDMKTCITYFPNKDNDLLCFMERYLKAEKEKRPGLLKQIKRCINGQEYENPFLAYYCYSQDDIDEFSDILNEFINCIKNNVKNEFAIKTSAQSMIIKINELNTRCKVELIDTWRREKLIDFIEKSGNIIGFNNLKSIVNEYRTW